MITTVQAKADTYLQDSDSAWSDWSGYPTRVVKVGQSLQVLTNRYDDGRVYYTAFVMDDGRLYTFTTMRAADGVVHPNCGDGPISRVAVCNALGIDYYKGPGRRPTRAAGK